MNGHYDIKEIRKIQNKPFKVFKLSNSEIGILIPIILFTFLGVFVGSAIVSFTGIQIPMSGILFFSFFVTTYILVIFKVSNKKFSEGIIFFILKKTMNIYKITKLVFFKTKEETKKVAIIKSSKRYTRL
jgi:hypothetical protein